MAASATKVLNVARSQIGYTEGHGNMTKFGDWYGMDGVSWCDIFITWCGAQADAAHIVGRAAYTPSHAAWFKAQGRWGRKPRRGAIVFFDFPDTVRRIQHVGIVERVRSDGRIVTIEGNTSGGAGSQSDGGGVHRRVRSMSAVVGFGYPEYGSENGVRRLPPEKASRGSRAPLIVDGVWGKQTTRALQRYIGVEDDGEIGPQTRRGLQRVLGIEPDGVWGRVTHKELQKALSVDRDGDWGKVTIKALQRKLNDDWRK